MNWNNQAISPSDVEQARTIFDAAGIPWDRIRFHYRASDDRWVLHDAIGDTLIAERGSCEIEWSAV